jgi:hypothetical protein
MFFHEKNDGARTYLQLVKNRCENGKSRQRVIATIERLDRLQESGELESILRTGARFSKKMIVISAHEKGETTTVATRRIGPGLIFERLWAQSDCQSELKARLEDRCFLFDVERVVFMAVLNRLFRPYSDRQCDRWVEDYRIEGKEQIRLDHYYRATAWLGEELPAEQQRGALSFSPSCTKDLIEEGLFFRRRDLFSSLGLVFFDTTRICFEGQGGQTLGGVWPQ